MHGKEFINDIISTYFTLVTMITVAMLVLGTYFIPNTHFGYEAFAAPLIYAGYATLPNIVMYSKKELTIKSFLIRKVIQFILVEIIVLSIALPDSDLTPEHTDIVIALAISVFIIFVLSHLYDWFQNYVSAKNLTKDLLAFQQNHQ